MTTTTIDRDRNGLRVTDKTTLMSLGDSKWPRDPGGCAERTGVIDASSVQPARHGENHLLAAIPPLDVGWRREVVFSGR